MSVEFEEYEIVVKIFSENREKIEQLVNTSKHPYTAKALYRFSIKIDTISQAIGDLGRNKYLYPSLILLRSLYEHLIIYHYIWIRYRYINSDECGKEYYIDYFVAEFLKREGFDLKVEGIRKNKNKNNNVENIKTKYEFLKDATQNDLDRIYLTGNQFDVSKIGNYLVNEVPTFDLFAKVHVSMLGFLNKYNRLSSFVHGGPISEKEIFENLSKEEINKELKELDLWRMKCSTIPKEHLIYFLADENPEIIRLLVPLRNHRNVNSERYAM